MEKVRINKYLRDCGIGSRRHVEDLIRSGHVAINGTITKDLATLVSPQDKVTLHGKEVSPIKEFVYYMLNKPKGTLCTHKPHNNEPTVYDLLPKSPPLFSIGRLDKDTTGLLLLTNDGDFANRVIHPSSNIPKEYIATTKQNISISHLQHLKQGTTVEETFITPKSVEKLSLTRVKIVVTEGKKREIRILIQNAGLDLFALTRTKIGPLALSDLPEGAFRPLTLEELAMLSNYHLTAGRE